MKDMNELRQIARQADETVKLYYPLIESEIIYRPTQCGYSIYITFFMRKYNRFLNGCSLRISDHSVGIMRYAEHYHLSVDDADASIMDFVTLLAKSYNWVLDAPLPAVNKKFPSNPIDNCSGLVKQMLLKENVA